MSDMSTGPPDRPTEPLRPRAPLVHERAAPPGVDPNLIILRLEDAVGSLRNALLVVGAIALVAFGLAIYALVSDDDGGSGRSRSGLASDARVSRVDERVDRLSRQVRDLRPGGATSNLADRVEKLETTVEQLDSGEDPTQAIEDLSSRVEALDGDVEQLQQSQSQP